MKLDDILSMSNKEFNKLSYDELKPIVQKLNKVANDRMYKIKKANVFSPAVEDRETFKLGKIEGKNKLNQLRAKYREVSDFISLKTSTVKGAKKFEKMVQGSINELREGKSQLNYSELSVKQQSKLWKLYNAIREIDPVAFATLDSDQKMAIASMVFKKNRSFENLRIDLTNYLDKVRGEQDVPTDLLNAEGLLFD